MSELNERLEIQVLHEIHRYPQLTAWIQNAGCAVTVEMRLDNRRYNCLFLEAHASGRLAVICGADNRGFLRWMEHCFNRPAGRSGNSHNKWMVANTPSNLALVLQGYACSWVGMERTPWQKPKTIDAA